LTSDRKIKANRGNARISTGPKTCHGRARAAKNAFRHGLSLPVHSDQALCEEVQTLADQIAGPHASAHVQILARRVAEAQVDLRRVRYARQQLLSHALNDPYYDSRANVRMKIALIRDLLRPNAPEIPMAALEKFLTSTPQGADKFATILLQEAKKLLAIDRYERRALSRRKFAIRAFDAAHRRPATIEKAAAYSVLG
jgi:protein-tyrosine-phosphatase